MKPDMMVMLTTDSNIDRRIIQEADSLESAGWKVTIIAMPKTSKLFSNDERIIRLPFYSATEKNSVQLFLLQAIFLIKVSTADLKGKYLLIHL